MSASSRAAINGEWLGQNSLPLFTLTRWLLKAASGKCKLTANNSGLSKVSVKDMYSMWTGVR